jgi:hypothetical protein
MPTQVMNPLDTFESLINDALMETYTGIRATNRPPALDEIEEYFPAHFYQMLHLQVIIHELYHAVGVATEEELRLAVTDGLYQQFVPDIATLRFYLQHHHLSYFDADYVLQNFPVTGVW